MFGMHEELVKALKNSDTPPLRKTKSVQDMTYGEIKKALHMKKMMDEVELKRKRTRAKYGNAMTEQVVKTALRNMEGKNKMAKRAALSLEDRKEPPTSPPTSPPSLWQRIGELQPFKTILAVLIPNPPDPNEKSDAAVVWAGMQAVLQEIVHPTVPPPSALQMFHAEYEARSIRSTSFEKSLSTLKSHPCIIVIPTTTKAGEKNRKLIADPNPDYNILLECHSTFNFPTITFFGVTVDILYDKIEINGRTHRFSDLDEVSELSLIMDTWRSCVKFGMTQYLNEHKEQLSSELKAHPLLSPKMPDHIIKDTFDTKRKVIRDLLVDYHKRKSSIHADFHKEFEFRVLEPLRRIDTIMLVDQESTEINHLVEVGYRVLRDAENASLSLTNSKNSEEASVIYKVAMDRITNELMPKLLPNPSSETVEVIPNHVDSKLDEESTKDRTQMHMMYLMNQIRQ